MSKNKKILLIEDDPAVGRMYRRLFKFNGYEAVWVWNGPDGLEAAKKDNPDLILLDIMMPVMNGLEVLDKLKELKLTKEIPVIVLSNLAVPEEIEKALEKGAQQYLVKSDYEPAQVVALVDEVLGMKEKKSN